MKVIENLNDLSLNEDNPLLQEGIFDLFKKEKPATPTVSYSEMVRDLGNLYKDFITRLKNSVIGKYIKPVTYPKIMVPLINIAEPKKNVLNVFGFIYVLNNISITEIERKSGLSTQLIGNELWNIVDGVDGANSKYFTSVLYHDSSKTSYDIIIGLDYEKWSLWFDMYSSREKTHNVPMDAAVQIISGNVPAYSNKIASHPIGKLISKNPVYNEKSTLTLYHIKTNNGKNLGLCVHMMPGCYVEAYDFRSLGLDVDGPYRPFQLLWNVCFAINEVFANSQTYVHLDVLKDNEGWMIYLITDKAINVVK